LNDGAVNCMGVNGSFNSKFSINLYIASAHGRLLLGNHPFQRLKVAAMFNIHRLVEC